MIPTDPKIRRATKTKPLYLLNQFPVSFERKIAASICVHRATRGSADLEGKDWERIFAEAIGADWSPSNVGLDDITHSSSSTAWGAKSVKGKVLTTSQAADRQEKIRLISGRNSTNYSFGESIQPAVTDPDRVGEMVLGIWNLRVREVRAKFENLRTVVLIKGDSLNSIAIFEFETQLFIPSDYKWNWNKNGNLEGKKLGLEHCFTWQPHGSQFTIVEAIPKSALRMAIKQPQEIDKNEVLQQIGFDDSFYSII